MKGIEEKGRRDSPFIFGKNKGTTKEGTKERTKEGTVLLFL